MSHDPEMKLCVTCKHCVVKKQKAVYSTVDSKAVFKPAVDDYFCKRTERWQRSPVTGDVVQTAWATECTEERAPGEGRCGPAGRMHVDAVPRRTLEVVS